jgi:hypothetical protein
LKPYKTPTPKEKIKKEVKPWNATYANDLQNRGKPLGFHGLPQNWSGSVLKTDRFSIKTKSSTVA